jgi:hypothetical protein
LDIGGEADACTGVGVGVGVDLVALRDTIAEVRRRNASGVTIPPRHQSSPSNTGSLSSVKILLRWS